MMNVIMACTSSALVSGFTSYKRSNTNNFDVQSGLNGFIVGYVSITASSYAIECWEALLISFVGTMLYESSRRILLRFEIDDHMDAFSTHGVCGMWSLMTIGIFDHSKGIF